MTRRLLGVVALGLAVGICPGQSGASEIGHYVGGLANIRDLAVPDPGLYVAVYNYAYRTDTITNARGHEIDGFTLVGPRGRQFRVDLDVEVDLYALAPMLMWVSPWKILGAKYGAYVAPTFSNTSIAAALSVATEAGLQIDDEGFGVGDLYVQPVWLGWTLDHFDFAFGMGFYAPVGKYDVRSFTIPGRGTTIKVEALDNLGLGFWTQQTQVAGYWYPFANKATAVGLALTHEIHGEKEDFDITPGQNLTINWGVSQYLPLTSDQHLLLEVGPAGYDTWQVTEDSGDDVIVFAKNEVHGVGGQVGLTYVPWTLVFNLHYFHEYDAVARFEGDVFGLTLAKKF